MKNYGQIAFKLPKLFSDASHDSSCKKEYNWNILSRLCTPFDINLYSRDTRAQNIKIIQRNDREVRKLKKIRKMLFYDA